MEVPATQQEVAGFLARLTGQGVVETHISAVFLGDGEALKLKKAVALGFLDFTALAERERLLRRECAINAPYAPGLYLGVEPITRGPDGAPRLGGGGPALDWVLRMKRLPADAFLDARPCPEGAMLDALADSVAAMHAVQPVLAGPDRLRPVIDGNLAAMREAGVPAAAAQGWHRAASAEHARLSPWLDARGAQGFRRRCHGDLHLGNICLLEGRPVPFDALEFDEALAGIDVGYDLAFLLMDLEQRHGRPAANRVLNRYVARGGDAALVRGLPLWLSLRAVIRAHVQARRGQEWRGLLDAAMAYLAPRAPRLLAIGGLQGTGKSTLARQLAPQIGPAPGALILRSDDTRKRLAGVAPETRLAAEHYTAGASVAVFAEMRAMAAAALEGGHAAILDAVFARPEEREAAAALHPSFTGLWLEAPLDTLRARVSARKGDASDADVAVLETSAARDPGPIVWQRIDAASGTEAMARKALDLLPFASP
ncbi:hypothetical protein EOD42_19635 [Rhodovarius crocodyli]|uniref:Aminoglycoside phosphotransferase domain-containing protein n=1 Tax=Rhodovarius crocodyli TaxID=1979269 RepID=A0A437M324_9PROT|nr:bifunctional aminoglycoside phosphotransferase/ATP-binding protein [Rhodovarius crocodyli]RVT91955.1 hypothetical protein EOD42_19635 [Rhodovarius crocodyli]